MVEVEEEQQIRSRNPLELSGGRRLARLEDQVQQLQAAKELGGREVAEWNQDLWS